MRGYQTGLSKKGTSYMLLRFEDYSFFPCSRTLLKIKCLKVLEVLLDDSTVYQFFTLE